MTTKKKSDPVDAPRCANCGAPAVWVTKNRGAEPTHYCGPCGAGAYPQPDDYLERL